MFQTPNSWTNCLDSSAKEPQTNMFLVALSSYRYVEPMLCGAEGSAPHMFATGFTFF